MIWSISENLGNTAFDSQALTMKKRNVYWRDVQKRKLFPSKVGSMPANKKSFWFDQSSQNLYKPYILFENSHSEIITRWLSKRFNKPKRFEL